MRPYKVIILKIFDPARSVPIWFHFYTNNYFKICFNKQKNIQKMIVMKMVYLSVAAFRYHQANQNVQVVVQLFTNLTQKKTAGRELQI